MTLHPCSKPNMANLEGQGIRSAVNSIGNFVSSLRTPDPVELGWP